MLSKLNNSNFEIKDNVELFEFVKKLKKMKSFDLTINLTTNSSLTVLAYDKRLFVMYLPNFIGNSYVAIDKKGRKNIYVDFELSNGQLDEYDEYHTVSKDYLEHIVVESYIMFDKPSVLTWEKTS